MKILKKKICCYSYRCSISVTTIVQYKSSFWNCKSPFPNFSFSSLSAFPVGQATPSMLLNHWLLILLQLGGLAHFQFQHSPPAFRSAAVMIATNSQLREVIFPGKRKKSVTVVTVHLSSWYILNLVFQWIYTGFFSRGS